jgi:hypothetical protein
MQEKRQRVTRLLPSTFQSNTSRETSLLRPTAPHCAGKPATLRSARVGYVWQPSQGQPCGATPPSATPRNTTRQLR